MESMNSAVWVCVLAGTVVCGICIGIDRGMLPAVSICVVDGTVLYNVLVHDDCWGRELISRPVFFQRRTKF
jgi:hypothetical protein